MPRLAYWPTAVMGLQIEQHFRFLGFLSILACHDLSRTNARNCHFVLHEIGSLIIPDIPPLGEIYCPRAVPRRSVAPARTVPAKLAMGIRPGLLQRYGAGRGVGTDRGRFPSR